MTPDQQISYLEMLTGYLQLPIDTPSRPSMRAELDELVPTLSISSEASEALLYFGDPDLLSVYIGENLDAFTDSLGPHHALDILGPAPGGAQDTLRAVSLLKDAPTASKPSLCDAALRLALDFDDPCLLHQICTVLGAAFEMPGQAFTKRAPWHRDTPRMHAWAEGLMRRADLSSDDWRAFVKAHLSVAHPKPLALMIACGINPRRVCPEHAFASKDWTYLFWESLAISHSVLALSARLPAFTEICCMPAKEIVALLRTDP